MRAFKLFPALLCAAVLCSCTSDKSGNSDTAENTTENVNGNYYYLEYDDTVIDKDCALAVEKYFHSIEAKDFDMYKETIYPDYFDNMNDLLEKEYSYGLDTVFDELYDKLLSSAASYLPTDETDASAASFEITEIEFSKGQDEDVDAITENYQKIFGDEFCDDLKNNTDELIDVYFSIVAKCNGDSEQYILTDNEILVVKENDDYCILG